MATDPEIAKYNVRVFELFGSLHDIVTQDNFFRISFKDLKHSKEIYLSLASRFKPDGLTPAQIEERFPTDKN